MKNLKIVLAAVLTIGTSAMAQEVGTCFVQIQGPCTEASGLQGDSLFIDTFDIAHENAIVCIERAEQYKAQCNKYSLDQDTRTLISPASSDMLSVDTSKDLITLNFTEVRTIFQVGGANLLGAQTKTVSNEATLVYKDSLKTRLSISPGVTVTVIDDGYARETDFDNAE